MGIGSFSNLSRGRGNGNRYLAGFNPVAFGGRCTYAFWNLFKVKLRLVVNKYLLIILTLCVLLVPVFCKTKRFDRFWGILMFILGFGALFLRLIILKDYPLLSFFNRETIYSSSLLMTAPTVVFLFFCINSDHFKRRIKSLKKLFLPYVLFGGLQQIFFFWVFTDTFYYLFRDIKITFLASVLFFMALHFTKRSPIKKLWVLLGLFAIINAWIYLIWGNIIPQLVVHGILGSVLYTKFTDTDQIKRRLG